MDLRAQAIKGEVVDEDKRPLSGVNIENIYTSLVVQSGEQGAFIIAATSEQLLEFKKTGYKTTRVRIPKGYVPSYFRIILKKGINDINQGAIAGKYDYRKDSLRYYELYKHVLDFPKMSAVQVMAHPFTAMSRVNQQKWRFQDRYIEFEEQKYVDRTFNATLIAKTTGLRGDSLTAYIRRFRPSYEQLRMMNDYTFYLYIKNTVKTYRSRITPRNSQ
jgi:hypothetical protein